MPMVMTLEGPGVAGPRLAMRRGPQLLGPSTPQLFGAATPQLMGVVDTFTSHPLIIVLGLVAGAWWARRKR